MFRNMLVAGMISVSAAAALAAPAYAAPSAANSIAVDKCSLHVNIAHPRAGQIETLTVTSGVPGTTVRVKIYYKTVSHTWNLKTSRSTSTGYEFGVGRPTKGYRAYLDGTVINVPRGYRAGATCLTSFLPE